MTTTIQATRKKYKLQMLLATLLTAFGIVVIVVSPRDGAGLLWGTGLAFLGLGWYAVARFVAWWRHG